MLQEQSLIEEARWKLAALQSEGGPGLRRRQRAVLLQLREQRCYLRRLIETQNLAAQQRRLLLLQHHHLLATTSSLSATGNKGYSSNSRGHSPNPSSPRLTPRMMEISISSSSEGQDDISLHLSVKSKDTGSSSLSDNSSHDRQRSRSAERKRITSARLQDKRRGVEVDPLQKAKASYESQEKEIKAKRKIDASGKRSREKREKSPIVPARISENIISAESSIPEESIEASTHDSSMTEEGGSESVSHSDFASSVSEHEGIGSKSEVKTSVPSELTGMGKSSSVEEVLTDSRGSLKTSSRKVNNHSHKSSSKTESVLESGVKQSLTQDSDSTIKTLNSERSSHETGKSNSVQSVTDKSSVPTGLSKSVISDSVESESKASEVQSSIQTSIASSERPSKTRGDASSGSVANSATQASVSFKTISQVLEEKTSNSKGSESKSSQRSSSRAFPLPLRVPLSPRTPHRQRRRYSSESDDSFTLSQTETASDVSDGEGKLLALKEQLASRRAEADKLRREKRRLRRERLTSQEQALRQQIANYDTYIQQAKLELERESKELQQVSQVRPLIKKPQVAESKKLKHSESLLTSPDKSDVSDLSILSECSKSDQSLSSKSQEGKSEQAISAKLKLLKSDQALPLKAQELESKTKSKETEENSDNSRLSQTRDFEAGSSGDVESDHSKTASERSLHDSPVEDAVLSRESGTSVSEEYSFEEDSTSASDHSVIDKATNSLSRDSSIDTDQSPSQASSTETIVHSPKKLDSSKNDEVPSSVEVCPVQTKSDADVKKDENAENVNQFVPELSVEVENKLDIYIPTPHAKSEADESSYQDKDTSLDESIGEEIVEISQAVTVKDDSCMDSSEKDIVSIERSNGECLADVLGEDKDQLSLILEGESEKSSKDNLVQDNQLCQDPPQIETKEEVKRQEELVSQATSLIKQRQVDDISNCILATLMKETTVLFAGIMQEKEVSSTEVPDCDHGGLKEETSLLDEEMMGMENSSGLSTDDDIGNDCSARSQVLKRVNDLIAAENASSPRSASLSSPRITQPLTFDISPDALSPKSSPG